MAIPKRAIAGVLVAIMLFCGALLTLNKKLQYQTSAVGLVPEMGPHAFKKPWFCTCCMFVGEAMALLAFGVKSLFAPEEKKCELSWWGVIWRCSLPAALDLSASGLGSVGLLYITASTFQMLRGWSILFTAILSRFWLGRVLELRQVVGLSLVFAAMGLIGFVSTQTGVRSGDPSASLNYDGLWGVLLVAFAQLFQASQFVWEEKVMKKDFIPPWIVLGVEGIVGILIFCVVVFPLLLQLPGNDVGGTQENVWDSLAMIQNSPQLVWLFAVYLVCVSSLNCSAVYVTKFLSGVHRSLVQTGLRTMFIWAAGLMLFYNSHGAYGEPWNGALSCVELVGFSSFLLGSMFYSKMLELPSQLFCNLCKLCNLQPKSEYKPLPAGP